MMSENHLTFGDELFWTIINATFYSRRTIKYRTILIIIYLFIFFWSDKRLLYNFNNVEVLYPQLLPDRNFNKLKIFALNCFTYGRKEIQMLLYFVSSTTGMFKPEMKCSGSLWYFQCWQKWTYWVWVFEKRDFIYILFKVCVQLFSCFLNDVI